MRLTPLLLALSAAASLSDDASAFAVSTTVTVSGPRVTRSTPQNNSIGFDITAAITANVYCPFGGIDGATLTTANVYLVRTADHQRIPALVNGSPVAISTDYAQGRADAFGFKLDGFDQGKIPGYYGEMKDHPMYKICEEIQKGYLQDVGRIPVAEGAFNAALFSFPRVRAIQLRQRASPATRNANPAR